MDYKDAVINYGEDIKTGTSDSILASLFRTILSDIGMDIYRFNGLLLKHLSRVNSNLNIREISSIRGNLSNELLRSVMTWKVFIKGLLFLNVQKFDLNLTLESDQGQMSVHRMSVDTQQFSAIKNEDSVNPDYILSDLFKQIRSDLKVTEKIFNENIVNYIRRSNIIDEKEISSAKGNHKKELNRPHMTWRVFIKGLLFLNTDRFTLEICLHHLNRQMTTHSKVVILNLKEDSL